MPPETGSGPKRPLDPELATSEELLAFLELCPPAELAAASSVVAGIERCIGELAEIVRTSHLTIARASRLLERLQVLQGRVIAARPEKYAPRPGGKMPNGLPNGPRMPQDGRGEG